MNMQVNDVVLVCRAPEPCHVNARPLVGNIGIVEGLKTDPDRVLVQRLTIEGRLAAGMAWLPARCLERIHHPAWAAAAGEYRCWFAGIVREQAKRERRRLHELEDLALRYGLTVEQVLEIARSVS